MYYGEICGIVSVLLAQQIELQALRCQEAQSMG
jgi:hypothetical protein